MASPPPSSRERLLGPDSTKVGRSPAFKENTVAADVLQALLSAEKGALDLKKTVQDIVGEYGWTENIANVVLGGLEDALKKGVQGRQVMLEAFKKVISEAPKFAHNHPYFCTLIALGILALLMPWVLEALGFAKLGPVKGTFAALWESTYSGYVPKESLFSFFQRLGMQWPRLVKL